MDEPTETVATRLRVDEIRELDNIAAASSRNRSQQIAHFVRLGMRSQKRRTPDETRAE